MESKKEVKINFFKKVWYSITKFEQYPTMAMEGLKRAIYSNFNGNSYSIFNTWFSNTNENVSRRFSKIYTRKYS